MATKFVNTLLLIITIVSVFAWNQSPILKNYNLQLTGALILLYFVSKLIFRRVTQPSFVATLVLVSISLLLIFSSGGISSPIFFVLYFLLFAIALLLSPSQAAIASTTLVIILFWQNYQDLTSLVIIDLLTLILITPLAIIFSNNYLKYLQSEGKIYLLKEAIKDEEVESLLWISTTAKPSIASVLNSISDIVIYLNTKTQSPLFPKSLLEKLKTIQKDLISLYSSTGTFQKSIEDKSDKIEL
ncbi:MAG TPA: hypothetical protein VLH94_01780 [Spirochaetia bacterium]|nr:hypothetical protein [Spirochaetia bacterium]